MRAVYYKSHGGPDVLEFGKLPVPEPEDNQVLVQVAAVSVNPIDRRLRNGELQEYITRIFPVVPGWDFSGRIVKLGKNVSDWRIGDEVIGLAFTWSIQHGTYAEYVPVDTSCLALKPREFSFITGAALPLISLTAWQSLDEYANLNDGQTVLIQAGAGGVGSVAIPMAKYLGATVYTTARKENFEYVSSLGADNVIDHTSVDYAAEIIAREPDGLDMVLESLLGEGVAETAIRLTKTGGCVAFMNNEPPPMADIIDRDIKAEFIHHRPDGDMLAKLLPLFVRGELQIPEINVMQLAEAQEAHRLSESGRTRGKIVLHIQDL